MSGIIGGIIGGHIIGHCGICPPLYELVLEHSQLQDMDEEVE